MDRDDPTGPHAGEHATVPEDHLIDAALVPDTDPDQLGRLRHPGRRRGDVDPAGKRLERCRAARPHREMVAGVEHESDDPGTHAAQTDEPDIHRLSPPRLAGQTQG